MVENEDMIAMITEIHMVNIDEGWWVDSGATCHVTPHRSVFKTYEVVNGEKTVFMGNSSTSSVMGKGTVLLPLTSGKMLTLKDVHHIPGLRKSLVSVKKLDDHGFKIVFDSQKVIISKKGSFVGKGYAKDNMYLLNINKDVAISAYIVDAYDNYVWHYRLGHIGSNTLNRMIAHNLVPKNSIALTTQNCECCAQAKIVKQPFKSVSRNTTLLELIHTDICDNKDHLTRGGKIYFITFIDDYSKYTYVYLLKTKDEAFEKFKIFKAEVENTLEKRIQRIRSDRGGEYRLNDYIKFCETHGIVREESTPNSPPQNGVPEVKIKIY